MRRPDRIRNLAFVVAAGLVALFVWIGGEGDRGASDSSARGAIDSRSAAEGDIPPTTDRDRARERAMDEAGDEGVARRTGAGARDSFERSGEPPRAEETDATRSDPTAASDVAPIALAPLRGSRDDATVSLAGFDPLGPRELLAWRIANGRFAVAARGTSDRDGNLHFPDLVAAQNGLEIVVTAVDGVPGLPGASEARSFPPRDPVAPVASVVESDATAHRLRIAPREASGVMVLADAYGVELARIPVRASPIPSTRDVEVSLTSTPVETYVLVSHEFEDGRSSDWETIVLPAVEVEADDVE